MQVNQPGPASDLGARLEQALDLAEARAELGAFWALDGEGARASAGRPLATPPGPLAGLPVAVKDMLDQAGLPTSAGLPGPTAPARVDADVVAGLREAGAIPIGKTAMDPLGCTTGGQAPGYPPCVNPIDPALSPGGSSAGSAVAVAAGIVPLALGTDTAGSVRVPAAYCGVVGFKPAHDALSRRGCVRVMPSFDTVGLLGDSVDRCAAAYAALAGPLPPVRAASRIALLPDLLEQSDEAVAELCRRVGMELEAAGAEVREQALAWQPDGLGVALAHELAETWEQAVAREPDRFTAVIRDTIAFGRRKGPGEYRRFMDALPGERASVAQRFDAFDVVVCPTVPIRAPLREQESVRVSTSFTRVFNALDWPAISVPVGRVEGAPVAVQVAAPPTHLGAVVDVARRIERLTR